MPARWGLTKIEHRQLRHEGKKQGLYLALKFFFCRRKDAFKGKRQLGVNSVVGFFLIALFGVESTLRLKNGVIFYINF